MEYKLSDNTAFVLIVTIIAVTLISLIVCAQPVTLKGTMNISGNVDTIGSWVSGVGILEQYPDAYTTIRLNEVEGTIEMHYEIEVPFIVWITSGYRLPYVAQTVDIDA